MSRSKPSDGDRAKFSRRGFLKGASVTVAAVGVTGAEAVANATQDAEMSILGPGPTPMKLTINDREYVVNAEPSTTLLDLLRDHLDMTGSKRVCNRGFCGACTVTLDGKTANACSMLAVDAVGKKIGTIEGISDGKGELSQLQKCFVKCDALQCGYCTPGMVVASTALLASNKNPARDEIKAGIAGNICRCGTYQNIFEAVEMTAKMGGVK